MTPTQRTAAERLECGEPSSTLTAHELAAWADDAAALLRELAAPPCACGDRAAAACPGEWEPGCDLGANEKFVRAAEPAQEPVAWCALTTNGRIAYFEGKPMVMPGQVGNEHHDTPLFAHPPQRQPLSDEAFRFDREPPDDCTRKSQCLARGACWRKCSLAGETK